MPVSIWPFFLRSPSSVSDACENLRDREADVSDIVAYGAELLLDESSFPEAKEGTALVGPQVLVNVDHCKSLDSNEMGSADRGRSDGPHDGGDLRPDYRHHEGRER